MRQYAKKANYDNELTHEKPFLGFGKDGYYNIFVYLTIFLTVLLALTPMIIPHIWPRTHDEGARYILLFDEFRDAFIDGILYPRWLPDAYGGYGYPNFLFYQPGFFFAALPFSFLPDYPLTTMYATLIFLFFIGGIGIYRLCKELSDRFTGFFCAVLFLLTPYLYVNLYVRGDLSELMAMLLCPWPIYFLIILKKHMQAYGSRWVPMTGITISLLAVLISHPATAMFFLIAFGLIAIYVSLDLGRLKGEFIFKVILSTILGLIVSSPYWATIFQMEKYVNLAPALSGPYYSAELHIVYLPQFFSRYWGFGLSTPNAAGDGISFQLGLPHFLLATIGVLGGRKNKIIQTAYALYIFFLLLMTPISTVLWKEITFLRYIQFPWRILSVTALLQIICVSGITNILVAWKYGFVKKTTMLGLLLISTIWYANEFQINNNPIDGHKALELHKQSKLENFYTYTCKNEFTPRTASVDKIGRPRGNDPLILLNPPGKLKELPGNSHHRIRYQISNEVPTTVLINQFYMPGWRLIMDGNNVPTAELEKSLAEDGRIQFFVPSSGNHSIEAFYGGPPGGRVRNFIIVMMILIFVAYSFFSEKNAGRIKDEA